MAVGDDKKNMEQPKDDQPSLNDIMSEYRYEATVAGRSRRGPDQTVSEDTKKFQALANEMKTYARERQAESFAEAAPPSDGHQKKASKRIRKRAAPPDGAQKDEITTASADFGPSEDFDRAFSPSDDFIGGGEETPEEVRSQPPWELFLIRLRRFRRAEEPVTASPPPDKAAARLALHIRFLNIRLSVALFLCAVMTFLTFSHQLEISLPPALVFLPQPFGRPYVYLSILLALQVLVMACGIDVLARGLSDLCRLKPGYESMVLLSCLANIAYPVSTFFNPGTPAYLPYCAVSALSVLCALWSQRQRLNACRRSYLAAAAAGQPLVLSREETLWPGGALVKTPGTIENFVGLTEQPDGAARFARFFAPLALIAAVMLTVIVSVGQGEPARFFWALAAILSVGAPFCGAFCYTLPFLKIAKRLSRGGTAMAGWIGARASMEPAGVLLTDRDLFPPGTITLNGLKVFEGFSFDRMICCAASLTAASGSGLAHAFAELLHNQPDAIRPVTAFRHYEGGGLGGEIGRDSILMGNASFMLRMGIRLPQGIKLENVIFVSVNLELVGVFAVHYTAASAARNGLSLLLRNGFTPILATRDVNLTPPFVGKKFGLDLSAAEYPLIDQRLELSDPERETWTGASALLSRDALYPCAEAIVAGRRLGQVTRINLLIYLTCALAGLLFMAFLTFRGEAAAASPTRVLAYLALWTLPTMLASGWVHRY